MPNMPGSIDDVQTLLGAQDYVCGRPLATVAFLALKLGGRCFSKARPGPARPRSPRRSPPRWAGG